MEHSLETLRIRHPPHTLINVSPRRWVHLHRLELEGAESIQTDETELLGLLVLNENE